MTVNYIVADDQGHSGQTLSLTQGETRQVTVFLFNADGTPFVWLGTLSELLLKIFTNTNQSAIQKKFSLAEVSTITVSDAITGIIGFQFTLSAANTVLMTANSSGLPMTAKFTDGSGNVTEMDFISMFNVSLPVVQT